MDIPWPERGERLFVGGGHAAHAACIIPEEISLVAVGYKDAADILVQVLGERGRNDALVFPIVFCYRQCLELQIKAITRLVESFDGCGDDFQKIHGLARLWRVIEPRLRQEDGGAEAAAFYAVQERIEELDRKSVV